MSRSARATSALALAVLVAAAVPAAAQRANEGEDESAALVEVGRRALRAGKLGDAAKALDQAIALNPRRVEAYVLRSAVYAAGKQYAGGIALLRKAQALAPADDDVLTALGSQLVLSGDSRDGVPLLEQVVGKEPARYDAQLLLGHYWHDAGTWPKAIGAYEAYFAHRPAALAHDDARYQIDLGDAYLRFRQPGKALALFQQAAHERRGDLRARLGIAWATAALDCTKARPLLHELDALAAQHPEIWLVDGQCALALGDPGGALALGRRYLERATRGSAAGHALVGEALAARGRLGDAAKELAAAHALEPAHRSFTVRLAAVLRRAGKPADAVAALEQLGAPSAPALDPEWWRELGEALLAAGDARGAATRLAAIAPELPDDAALRTVLGAAQLAAGDAEAAVATLDRAEAIRKAPRSRELLVRALATLGATKLAAGDAAGAAPLLVRASTLDPSALVLRDLGIAYLALDRAADALPVLDRAAKADGAPITLMLAARARALTGDVTGARPIYERALAGAHGDLRAPAPPVEIALDWAASELAGGDPAVAVAALEKTAAAARGTPLAARHAAALAEARHAAGLAALRAGQGGKAVEELRAAEAAAPSLATRCDLAVAEVAALDVRAALSALAAVRGQACPFPAPADTQAAPILIAFTEGLSPRHAPRALARLEALSRSSTVGTRSRPAAPPQDGAVLSSGAAAALLGSAIRVVALDAAEAAYQAGRLAAARRDLAAARAASSRVGADEVAHDLAVLDLAEGHTDAAIRELERLSARVPEALVNLGIAYERKGEQAKALDAWHRAKQLGVRFAPLSAWIDAKQRVYGGAP